MGLHIVIVGNVVDGLSFFGPFKTSDDALWWAEVNIKLEDWTIAPLQASKRAA